MSDHKVSSIVNSILSKKASQELVNQLREEFDGEFMEPEIEQGWWYIVETNNGTEYIPTDVMSEEEIIKEYGVDPEDIEEMEGWGARLSAPGYMDATDWVVFDTEEEAMEYLLDTYADGYVEDSF